MAMVSDDQPIFKHFCRICKKGFGCGRALGGHMRAHGIGDENVHMEDDDASDWDGNPPGNKRMYALRTNPNRLKSCRVCENCGKEFSSWKSFLEHGKCSSNEANDSLVSSPGGSKEEDGAPGGWSKRKRSKRAKLNLNCPSSEEEDLANCLVMLSAARVDPPTDVEAEESCASASREEDRYNFMAPQIMSNNDKAKGVVGKGMFECKACKKVFNSHQALGGHRASHKKVKGCFAAKLDDNLDESYIEEDVITHDEFSNIPSRSNALVPYERGGGVDLQLGIPSKRKSKLHECSICHRIFSSGQALGGHKRCHWVTSNSQDTSSVSKFRHHIKEQNQFFHQKPQFSKPEQHLDLNLLPATAANRVEQDPENNPLSLDVSTDICLRPWIGVNADLVHDNDKHHSHQHYHHDNKDYNHTINNPTTTNVNASVLNVDDEVDSKVKLAKLNDLKDLNTSGGSSLWLQVGIGSTSNVASES